MISIGGVIGTGLFLGSGVSRVVAFPDAQLNFLSRARLNMGALLAPSWVTPS